MHRFATILLIAASMRCADAHSGKLRGGVSLVHPAYATQQRRELGAFDWWSALTNVIHGGPLHHSGGSSSGSTSTSGGDGSDSDNGGDGGGEGDGDGGDEVDAEEEGWESNYLETSGSYSGTGSATGGTLGQTSLWVLVAAAMVAAATGVAFVVSRKRKSQDDDDVLSARAESLAGNLHSSNTVVTTRTTRTTEGMEMGLNDFAVPQSEDASVESALDYASLDAAIDDAATFLSAISKNAERNEHAMPGNRNEEVNANNQPSEGRLSKMKKRMHLWKKRRVDALI